MRVNDGFRLYREYFGPEEQRRLVAEVAVALDLAPPYRPITPGGKAMSVRMTNLGPLGWVTDTGGYRYEPLHPITRAPWPPIPRLLLDLWTELADPDVLPDACLVNLYDAAARMGLHQDRDEADFAFPVLSVSLGDTAIFRIGGVDRKAPTRSVRLSSGDVGLMAGEARLAFHGIDRVLPGTSVMVPGGERINLTLRRARVAPNAQNSSDNHGKSGPLES